MPTPTIGDFVSPEFKAKVAKEIAEAERRIAEMIKEAGMDQERLPAAVLAGGGHVDCPVPECKWSTEKGLQGLSVHLGTRHQNLTVAERRRLCGLPAKVPSQMTPKYERGPDEPLEERIKRLEQELAERDAVAKNGHPPVVEDLEIIDMSSEEMIRTQLVKIEDAKRVLHDEQQKLKDLVANSY